MLKNKIKIWLAYLMQGLIFSYIILALCQKDYLNLFGGIICLSITFLPLIIKRKWRITLPWTLNFLIVLSLYLYVGGQIMGWYATLSPFYDKIGHLIGSATVALLGFALTVIIKNFSELSLTKKQMVFFIVIFAMAIGTLWEIGEFATDQILGTNAQKGLSDTMYDLIFDLLGGLFIALLIQTKFEKIRKNIIPKILKQTLKKNL